MGLFGKPQDLIEPARLADFGRFWLLKEESGLDAGSALSGLDPLRKSLYHDPSAASRIAEELRRCAAKGEWEAIGAWQFSRDFLDDEELERELTDRALLALREMRITNLMIHLPSMDIERFEELTGGPAPDDGFRGPPVFDSHFGPSRKARSGSSA
jgi:hypothetical protein